MKIWLLLATLATFGFGVSSCDSVDAAFDCNAVCTKYKDCYNASFDVGQCRTNCRDNASADANFRQQADTCESCIDDRSCVDTTFSCATECAGVIASS